jgi:hypothetical protein
VSSAGDLWSWYIAGLCFTGYYSSLPDIGPRGGVYDSSSLDGT